LPLRRRAPGPLPASRSRSASAPCRSGAAPFPGQPDGAPHWRGPEQGSLRLPGQLGQHVLLAPGLSRREGLRGEGVAMHLALSQEVVAAIVTVGLTVVAGAIGYLIRERVTSAKPFVAVLEIDGGTLASGSRVDVPQDVVESIRRSPIFPDLEPSSRLSDIT